MDKALVELEDRTPQKRFLAELEARSTGPPSASAPDTPPDWFDKRSKEEVNACGWVLASAILKVGLVRSILVGLLGILLFLIGLPTSLVLRLNDISPLLAAIVAACGVILFLFALRGVPGGVAFLPVETPAGFHAKDHVEDAEVVARNERIRTSLTKWLDFKQTSWVRGGEARTVLGNVRRSRRAKQLTGQRVWMVADDGEQLACDWVFPKSGYNPDKPVLMMLPGLAPDKHWSETCEFVSDVAYHMTFTLGITVAIMIPRGAMGLPVKKNNFSAARATDMRQVVLHVEDVLKTIGRGSEMPPIFGAAFSMSALNFSNYCGHYAGDERLSGVVCFSGACDMTTSLKSKYVMDTWSVWFGSRYKRCLMTGPVIVEARSRGLDMDRILSTACSSINSLDREFQAPFNGYTLEEYCQACSLNGDDRHKKVAIPLLNVAARDDYITHCDALCAQQLSADNANILFLITEEGGHVGWPPTGEGYIFLNGVLEDFMQAVLAKTI